MGLLSAEAHTDVFAVIPVKTKTREQEREIENMKCLSQPPPPLSLATQAQAHLIPMGPTSVPSNRWAPEDTVSPTGTSSLPCPLVLSPGPKHQQLLPDRDKSMCITDVKCFRSLRLSKPHRPPATSHLPTPEIKTLNKYQSTDLPGNLGGGERKGRASQFPASQRKAPFSPCRAQCCRESLADL